MRELSTPTKAKTPNLWNSKGQRRVTHRHEQGE